MATIINVTFTVFIPLSVVEAATREDIFDSWKLP